MSFLYFFEERYAAFSIDKLDEREASKKEEIADVLRGEYGITKKDSAGPEGKRGVLIQLDHPEHSGVYCDFKESEQVWRKCGDSHYIGYWKSMPPSPKTLSRKSMLDGETVEINGHKWIIPICEPTRTTLPQTFELNEEGDDWVPRVSSKYEHVQKMCEKVMDLAEIASDREKVQYGMFFVAKALGLNYHVGKRELAMLGVMTSDGFAKLFQGAIGLISIAREEEQVKKQVATDGAG